MRRFLRFSGFYLVSALFSSISTLAMLLLKEPVVTEAQAARSSHSLRELPGQFAQLVRDSAAALRGCPLAAKLIAADAVISVPCYLTKMFLQQRLVELGWPTEWLFLPLLLGGAACVAGTEIGRRVHPHTLRRFYTVCALLVGGGTFLVGAAPAWGGILGMMLVQGVLEVWLLHADQRLNALISSDQRATLISVDSMAYSILMIPASPFVGAVGDLFGQAGAGLALLVVWPEDALPVLFLLPEVVVVFLLLAAAAAFWASSFFCPAVYKAVVSLVVPFSSTEPFWMSRMGMPFTSSVPAYTPYRVICCAGAAALKASNFDFCTATYHTPSAVSKPKINAVSLLVAAL